MTGNDETREKGVIHLCKAAHRSHCSTACGIQIKTPTNHPYYYKGMVAYYYKGMVGGSLEKITCKNCKRTFLFVMKLRYFTVKRLLKGKIK